MNKDFEYITLEKQAKRFEAASNLPISEEDKRKLSFKEKYGKCNSRGMRNNFSPFKMGFFDAIPSDIPQGFNFALGYCQETIEMCYKKDKEMY